MQKGKRIRLSVGESALLELLSPSKFKTRAALAAELGISMRATKRRLQALRAKGFATEHDHVAGVRLTGLGYARCQEAYKRGDLAQYPRARDEAASAGSAAG